MKSYNPAGSTNFARCMLACSLFCCFAVAPALSQFSSLSPLPGTGKLKQPSKPTKFTFVVAGDNRPCTRTDKQSAIPEEIFKDATKKGADFVLWTGDTIYGKDKCNGSGKDPCDASTMKEEYKKFFDIAKDAGVPVFNAPGNHEMDNNDDVPNADMTSLYTKYAAQPYGSFDYGDSHFIALNTEEVGNPATSKNPANGEKIRRPPTLLIRGTSARNNLMRWTRTCRQTARKLTSSSSCTIRWKLSKATINSTRPVLRPSRPSSPSTPIFHTC